MIATYDPTLVVLSFLVAVVASFAALDLSNRLDVIGNRPLWPWIALGGCVMGLGIWSMHFIAMLAFHLPVAVGYNIPVTIASLLIAMLASAIGFIPLCSYELRALRIIGGAIAMGSGVSGMHYLGMSAMNMCPGIHYQSWLVALSVIIAILASGVALLLAFDLRRQSKLGRIRQLSAAIVMGFAVCGMHYCGMVAAHFARESSSAATSLTLPIPWVAGIVITFSLLIIAVAIAIAMLDARTNARSRALANMVLGERIGSRRSSL